MNCQHTQTEIVLTPELTHHGKIVCVACRKFLGWAKKPETIAREQRNAEAIVKLRNSERLSAWEREFIASLDGQGPKISPRQQEALDRMIAKHV